MTNERVEVLPVSEASCPACKSKTVKIVTISPDVGHGAVWPESFAVKCLACDMRGPRHIAQADALAAWNRLSSQSLPVEVREDEPSWLTKLRRWAVPLSSDDLATKALKKAGRTITQMHAEQAWCSSDVKEALDLIQKAVAALASPQPPQDEMVEQIVEAAYDEWLQGPMDGTDWRQIAEIAVKRALTSQGGEHGPTT